MSETAFPFSFEDAVVRSCLHICSLVENSDILHGMLSLNYISMATVSCDPHVTLQYTSLLSYVKLYHTMLLVFQYFIMLSSNKTRA